MMRADMKSRIFNSDSNLIFSYVKQILVDVGLVLKTTLSAMPMKI